MFNSKLIPFALLVFSPTVFAQTPLGAGGQLQQIPPIPTISAVQPAIQIKQDSQPVDATAGTEKIVVNRLKLTGSTLYDETSLMTLTGFVPGSHLSLADLQGMAARITSFYRQSGYFVAQAYLPAQEISNGVVTLAIIEGHYGRVTLNNQSRVSDELAYNLLDGIQSGDTVSTVPLEQRLLLLSDLPGAKVSSTLVPGATLGTSDLIVDLKPDRLISGSVDADNAGNRYTGANRIGATVNFNEPLGHGDVATLRALTSGPGLNYLRGAYQMQFGKATAGVAYSTLRYELGREFAALQANGSAQITSIYGSYPLIRSRNTNLSAALALDSKTFQDKVDSTSSVTDKKALVLTANVSGNQRDNLGGGGQSAYSLAWSTGNIDLQTPAVLALDAVTAHSQGHFNKLGFNLSRQQRVNDALSWSTAINGQLASKNLDVSEKMELGGMYAVRAYPEGEAYGDQGYVLTLEARWLLPKFSERLPGQVQLVGFVDTGRVTLNKNPWVAGQNQRTLSGSGIGVNWFETGNFMVRAYYAFKLGSAVATSAPDADGRFWIQAVKYF
jgi:hemolysin activation/secretion protein